LLGYYIRLNHKKFITVNETNNNQLLFRKKNKKIVFGVCKGLSEYFNINVSFVRTLFIVLSVVTFGLFILLYVVLFFTTKYKNEDGFESN